MEVIFPLGPSRDFHYNEKLRSVITEIHFLEMNSETISQPKLLGPALYTRKNTHCHLALMPDVDSQLP